MTSNPPPVLSVKANLRPEAGGAAGLVVAFDPVRYTVRAVLDSADITAIRTGAIAAVAARQLAGPGPRRLALLGAGPVARQSLAALSQVVELEQVRVWSRDQGRSENLFRNGPGDRGRFRPAGRGRRRPRPDRPPRPGNPC